MLYKIDYFSPFAENQDKCADLSKGLGEGKSSTQTSNKMLQTTDIDSHHRNFVIREIDAFVPKIPHRVFDATC